MNGQTGGVVRTFTIGILVFDGCQESCLAAPLDVFRILEAIGARGVLSTRVTLEARFISVGGGERRTAAGLQIQTEPAATHLLDALIAPGIHHRDASDIKEALPKLLPEAKLLADMVEAGKPVLGACSAVFLLGVSGVLDGRGATTSWWLGPTLHSTFPSIRVEAEGCVFADGPCVTGAGVRSYYDLALWLVQRFAGEEIGRACAKFLLLDLDRQSQTPFVIDSMIDAPAEDPLAKARAWLNERLTAPIRIEDLARHCGVSQRTLLRRFRETADRSPARYIQGLRLNRAKALLEETMLPVAEIVAQCGYLDVATFRKTFKLRIRLTPQQYRTRFHSVGKQPTAERRAGG